MQQCHQEFIVATKHFWKDRWLRNRSLEERFSDMFDLAQHQNKTVAEMWSSQGWDLIFRRSSNDWESLDSRSLYTSGNILMAEGWDGHLWWTRHSKVH